MIHYITSVRLFILICLVLMLPKIGLCLDDYAKLNKNEIKYIDQIIKGNLKYDTKHKGGNVSEEGNRIYLIGDIGRNGREGIAVQFTLGAGNADYIYLLIVERKPLKMRGLQRIGGRGFRDITINEIRNGLVCANVLWYGPNDSMPNPSVAGTTSFRLDFEGLVECDTVVGK
jgi:hypothetical protein